MSNNDALKNLHERIADTEAQQQVMVPLLLAICQSHPDRSGIKANFEARCESMLSMWLNQPIHDGWMDTASDLRALFSQALDSPK